MILPIQCKSCGKVIAHLWFDYVDKVDMYRDQDEVKEEQIAAEVEDGGPKTARVKLTPEERALNSLKIHRYCCRIMFLCQPRSLVDMIKNRIQN